MLRNKKEQPLDALLSSQDKGIGQADSTWAVVLRDVFIRRGITPLIMDRYINLYLNGMKDKFTKERSRATEKGNIRRQLAYERVTWGLLNKAAKILRVKAVHVKVIFHWEDGMITEHNVYPDEDDQMTDGQD